MYRTELAIDLCPARRNHLRVFEVRNVLFRIGHIANENPCNCHHYKSPCHCNYSDNECETVMKGVGWQPAAPLVAYFAYLASLKAISVEAAGTFSS